MLCRRITTSCQSSSWTETGFYSMVERVPFEIETEHCLDLFRLAPTVVDLVALSCRLAETLDTDVLGSVSDQVRP